MEEDFLVCHLASFSQKIAAYLKKSHTLLKHHGNPQQGKDIRPTCENSCSIFYKGILIPIKQISKYHEKTHVFQVLEYHENLKKKQVNICFFCRKKELISHHPKFQNKTFSVISKYHLPINVLAQKTGFPISEKLKARNCQQLVTIIFPSTF